MLLYVISSLFFVYGRTIALNSLFWFDLGFDNDFDIESKYHRKIVVLLSKAYMWSLQHVNKFFIRLHGEYNTNTCLVLTIRRWSVMHVQISQCCFSDRHAIAEITKHYKIRNPLPADSFRKYKTKVIPNKVCIIRLYTIKYCIFRVI